MQRQLLLRTLICRLIRFVLIAAVLAVVVVVLIRTAPLREATVAQSQGVSASAVDAASELHRYTTVREKDFGAWKYTATRNDIEGLHATVTYDRDTVGGIKAYVAANKALLPEIMKDTGSADVVVTFVYPVPIDWFRTWAKRNSLQVTQALLRTGAPGTNGGTVGVGGKPDDPLPQASIDNMLGGFFAHQIIGVFGAYGKVDRTVLANLGSDLHVFLVDVTPTFVRDDLEQSGVTQTDPLREIPRVELPFGMMEHLGLQNFTDLPFPTQIPDPVGTVVSTIIPPAP